MEIKHIKGNTFCIDTGMTYIPFYKIDDKRIIMLDSGWARGERKGIEEILEENNFKVEAIICSHAHIDHVGNNAYLKEKYNCIIAMASYEALICSSSVNLKLYYSSETLTHVTEHYGSMICKTDIMISDSENKVSVCGIDFGVFHTPGHSPAHICIITPDDVAYVGDSLISYEVMEGAKIPYAFILRQDLKSKEKLYNLKCSRYVVAHKGIFDDITTLIGDNMNFYKNTAYRVLNVMEGSMTKEEIIRSVIKNFEISVKDVDKYLFIERMLRSYLDYLKEIGKIEAIIEDKVYKYRKVC